MLGYPDRTLGMQRVSREIPLGMPQQVRQRDGPMPHAVQKATLRLYQERG